MLLGGYLMARLRVRVATKLHDDMLTRILRAPISFFDITPVGRIMNRFSKEQNSVDFMLTIDYLTGTMSEYITTNIPAYGHRTAVLLICMVKKSPRYITIVCLRTMPTVL